MSTNHFKPVRKIGMSSRAIVGKTPEGWQFESSLERDFMELIRFDLKIESYIPQPLVIEYRDSEDIKRRYTPDGYIEYRDDISLTKGMKNVICEIKYRKDFKASWRTHLAKFRAAKKFCEENDYEFKVYTEREIRTPYLDNVRFLYPYREKLLDAAIAERMTEKIHDLRETDPEALMTTLFRDKWKRAELLPVLWYLISTYKVGCELSEPLTMKSKIWTIGW